jgi:F-type H+-transporting ATPase subunit delta
MLWSFISQYREAHDIKVGTLVTAVQDDDLRKRLEDLFHDKTRCEVHFKTSVDPELIGGFVFEIDGRRLDASVRSQLERIRRSLVDETSRLV